MAAAHLGVANSPEAADAPPFALIQGPPGMRCTCEIPDVTLKYSGLTGLHLDRFWCNACGSALAWACLSTAVMAPAQEEHTC